MKRTHTCTAYIAKSKIGSNRENMSYNQIKMCMCVEFFWMELTPLSAWLYLYFEIWAIFSFLFFFFFLFLCFWARILFLFLPHSPYSFCNMKSHVKMIRVFLCGWKAYFCATSSVEVGTSICGVSAILILKAWNESHKGRKQFDKAQCKTSSIYVRFSKICQYMAQVGILYHWGAKLFYFRKIKSPSIFALRSKVSLILPTSATVLAALVVP